MSYLNAVVFYFLPHDHQQNIKFETISFCMCIYNVSYDCLTYLSLYDKIFSLIEQL